MIKDRGMKKWQGMMLPEHVAVLNKFFGEKKRVPKPDLNEWDLHANEETLQIALKRKCEMTIKMWWDGGFHFRGGIIKDVDLSKRTIDVDDPFGLHTYMLDSIVDVTVTE
ncbi:YolD-like family protein [Psychrobacillus sp. OK032]|uniref:YolD-like family protein n=1 Tax=Psychrobacillus sp. OK032 TaxID=1884358 RepID=UPI0008CC20B0|nr:YolD-like family protein [Psychrobacillus sp. OK032]SES35288.1 YolD-like protein [Psychrobacillus sp. OK032]